MADKVYISYTHHKKLVMVREDLKGTHRDLCMCYDCAKFSPGMPEQNCPIANLLYAVSLAHNTVTPVLECPNFAKGERYSFTTETGQP